MVQLEQVTILNSIDHNIGVVTNGVQRAVATWYGPPQGPGSGGACGFANDVSFGPFNGMISAGNNYLFQGGLGCGGCYSVKCINNAFCSGYPITVTITDECPGACNNVPIHFDLSGTALVPCRYATKMTFKVDGGSNPNYFACAIEYVPEDGAIKSVELKPSNSVNWLPMQESFGATWKININPGVMKSPFSIRVTTKQSNKVYTSFDVIPVGWQPNKRYP
ncbi:hypothetical protein LIER_09798 [Lithospermum erythrorhizon]|uniref:Uncharacterized protein n=1 Tax=Lithospermum erythrorhizon TaxID=34254 RepID=A0AAV3PK03_LITER